MKAGNNSRKNEDRDISDDLSNWSKLKNSKYRSRRFSAVDVPHVKLNSRFSVLDVDQQCTGFLEVCGKQSNTTYWEDKKSETKILLLGSSHGSETGPMLQEHVGTDYEITSILKSIAPLANVVEDLGKLGNDLTKLRSYYYSGRARKQPGQKLPLLN